jgi:hypothetical protein
MDHPKVVVGLDVGAETFAAAALRTAGEAGRDQRIVLRIHRKDLMSLPCG